MPMSFEGFLFAFWALPVLGFRPSGWDETSVSGHIAGLEVAESRESGWRLR